MCYTEPTTRPPSGSPRFPQTKLPQTVADLREEMKKLDVTLPESIYIVFQKAVRAHLDRQLEEAQEYYARLRTILRASGGTYDLAENSEVFRHNLQILEGQFAVRARQRR